MAVILAVRALVGPRHIEIVNNNSRIYVRNIHSLTAVHSRLALCLVLIKKPVQNDEPRQLPMQITQIIITAVRVT